MSLDVVAKLLVLRDEPISFLLQRHHPVERVRGGCVTVRFGRQVSAAKRECTRAARICGRVARRGLTPESLNLEKRVAEPFLGVGEIVFERSLGPPDPRSLLAEPGNLGVKPAPRAEARDGRLQGLDTNAAVLLGGANLGLEPGAFVTPSELGGVESVLRVALSVLRRPHPLTHGGRSR